MNREEKFEEELFLKEVRVAYWDEYHMVPTILEIGDREVEL